MLRREALASPHRGGDIVQQQRVPGGQSRCLLHFPRGRIGRTGPLAEDGSRCRRAERGQLLHGSQLLGGQLFARPQCLGGPGPGRDQHRDRHGREPPADQAQQSQRVRVGPVGVIKRKEQRLGGRPPQAAQDSVKVVRRSGRHAADRRIGRLRWTAQQRLQGLADQAERQGRLGHVRPPDPHLEPVPGARHRVIQDCRLPEPGLADHEQRPATALKRGPDQATHRLQEQRPARP